MNKFDCLEDALIYIEDNLLNIKDYSEIAAKIHVIYEDLQIWFSVIVGYSLPEYVRNRKLSEAAKELIQSKIRIIDIANKYGYDSPESFSRAFFKFHGVLPSKIAQIKKKVRIFSPITIDVSIKGGFCH